jgi:hypothetical protein
MYVRESQNRPNVRRSIYDDIGNPDGLIVRHEVGSQGLIHPFKTKMCSR